LLCAIAHGNSRTPAKKLIVGSFINILKTPPAAHVINEDRFESGAATYHIREQSPEFLSMFDLDATLSGVCVG
jgi:hypothetical protein